MPDVVLTVIVLVHEVEPGLQEAGLNEAVAPVGRPEVENVTAAEVPPVGVTVIVEVFPAVAPWITEILLDRERVYVKGVMKLNVKTTAPPSESVCVEEGVISRSTFPAGPPDLCVMIQLPVG